VHFFLLKLPSLHSLPSCAPYFPKLYSILYQVVIHSLPSCDPFFTKLCSMIYQVVLHTLPNCAPYFTKLCSVLYQVVLHVKCFLCRCTFSSEITVASEFTVVASGKLKRTRYTDESEEYTTFFYDVSCRFIIFVSATFPNASCLPCCASHASYSTLPSRASYFTKLCFILYLAVYALAQRTNLSIPVRVLCLKAFSRPCNP